MAGKALSSTLIAQRRHGTLLAALGVTALSFDALLVRVADTSAGTIIFWRGLFIALSVTLALRLLRGSWSWQALRQGGLPSLVISAGITTTIVLFVLAVTYTRVANVVVLLTAAPLFAALLSGVFLREWVPLRTWIAIVICLVGVLLVFAGSIGTGNWLGDGFALLAAFVLAGNYTLMRRFPGSDRLAVVAGAGLLACLVALPFASPLQTGFQSLLVLAVMGLVQMPLAMVLMAEATRYISSAEVSLMLVVETVLGTYWVWLFLGEEPPGATVLGGTVVMTTLALHAWWGMRRQQEPVRQTNA